eukprot:TCONS_00059833-protein
MANISVILVLLALSIATIHGLPKHNEPRQTLANYALRDFQVHLSARDNGCDCHGDSCYCCVHAEVEKIHLNHTVCVVLDYIPDELGLDVKLNIDDVTLFVEKVSLRNPPPLCAGIPHLEKYASVCIDFFNIEWTEKVGGCIKLDAKLAGITLEEINIGCFFYPLTKHQMRNVLWEQHVMEELRKSFKQIQAKKQQEIYRNFALEEDV